MVIVLSKSDTAWLTAEGVGFDPEKDYTEREAFDLLDRIYDAEIKYSNFPYGDRKASERAAAFAHIADKVQRMIPEE